MQFFALYKKIKKIFVNPKNQKVPVCSIRLEINGEGHALGGAAWNYPPRCSSFSAQGYGYVPNSQAYAGYSYQSYPAYQVYQSYQCYDPQPQQLQPSYSFDVSQAQPRYSLGRRVPLAQNRIISATKVEQ